MSIAETTNIPQADAIWDVARVPAALLAGVTSWAAIGTFLDEKGARQGDYYVHAARVLGLVAFDHMRGTLMVTPTGHRFAAAPHDRQQAVLRMLMREREPMRSVIVAMHHAGGLDLSGIAAVLQQHGALADSTAQRRAQTIVAWFRDLGIASWDGQGRLIYHGLLPQQALAPRLS